MATPKLALLTLEYPPQVGGVANYYYALAQAWPTALPVYTTEHFPKAWIKIIPWLLWLQRQHQFDGWVIGQVLPLGTVAYVVSLITHTPYTVFTHGMDVLVPQQSWRKRWLMRRILRRAQHIISASTFTQALLVKFDPSLTSKLTVVHPAPTITPLITPQAPKVPLPQQFILSVGRLVERKGFDQVIACLPYLPDVHYVIAGNGSYQTTLQAQASELGVSNRVHLLTNLSNAEISYLYQTCILFVMPSKTVGQGDVEGFGTVVLEANSFGKLAIGSRYSGMRDAIKDKQTGVLVTDQASLLAALKTLLGDQAYRQQLERSALQYAQLQTWPKRVEQLLQLWQ